MSAPSIAQQNPPRSRAPIAIIFPASHGDCDPGLVLSNQGTSR